MKLDRRRGELNFPEVQLDRRRVQLDPARGEPVFGPKRIAFKHCQVRAASGNLALAPSILTMPKAYFLPRSDTGIATTLVTFDTAINASSSALATKYIVTTAELNRVRAGRYTWQFFLDSGRSGATGCRVLRPSAISC